MSEGGQRLYWLGNVAKTRIVAELLGHHPGLVTVTVFDYGCGDGGDWPRILADHPHLRLVGFEPGADTYRTACQRLAGCNAEILTGDAMATLQLQADVIVSFSVFEHVVEPVAFLRHAKRVLAPDGIFYLNYDDGHFRNVLDLADAATWLPAIRARLRTLASPFLAMLGHQAGYQRRVEAAVADRLVAECGFAVQRIDYHNLSSLKELAKAMPRPLREDYSRWWLETEMELNRRFAAAQDELRYGDSSNLWRQMVSRTLCLRHR